MSEFIIRKAKLEDVSLILRFTRELAEYENLTDQVTATEESLREWVFRKGKAQAVIGEENGLPVGYALFFYNFSTFLGRAGIYIADLYVRPAHRKKGYGKAFFRYLAKLAHDEGYGRLEWACLDWNEPSMAFYRAMGAQRMDEWKVFRLGGDAIKKLAED
jgi:GNAT superfamily N-acetyltransferase